MTTFCDFTVSSAGTVFGTCLRDAAWDQKISIQEVDSGKMVCEQELNSNDSPKALHFAAKLDTKYRVTITHHKPGEPIWKANNFKTKGVESVGGYDHLMISTEDSPSLITDYNDTMLTLFWKNNTAFNALPPPGHLPGHRVQGK